MKSQTESIVLTNNKGTRLRIYKIEGDGPIGFCIGVEGDAEHFEFLGGDADEIIKAINTVVSSYF